MTDTNLHSASIPVSLERVMVGLWCDLHPNPTPCPKPELMEMTGDLHKLWLNAFFCWDCPVWQAIIDLRGNVVQ